MDPQYLEDLAALAEAYRNAERAFRKADKRNVKDLHDAHDARSKAKSELLAFAAEEVT